jgi:serine/threonine protein kinase
MQHRVHYDNFIKKCGKLTEFETVYCLKQMLKGLQYLHHYGFGDFDIKCANCLLFNDGQVKLADFGASKQFESESIYSWIKKNTTLDVTRGKTSFSICICSFSNFFPCLFIVASFVVFLAFLLFYSSISSSHCFR